MIRILSRGLIARALEESRRRGHHREVENQALAAAQGNVNCGRSRDQTARNLEVDLRRRWHRPAAPGDETCDWLMNTLAPPKLVGSGKLVAFAVELAKPLPKMVASDPGETRGA